MKRCHCRPGCLTWLDTCDQVVSTEHGEALAEHLDPSLAYPTDPLFELSEVGS